MISHCERLLVEISFVFCVRPDDSKLMIESSAPVLLAPQPGTYFQKRQLARAIKDGFSPSGRVGVSLFLEPPLTLRSKLSVDVEKAVSYVSGNPPNEIRPF